MTNLHTAAENQQLRILQEENKNLKQELAKLHNLLSARSSIAPDFCGTNVNYGKSRENAVRKIMAMQQVTDFAAYASAPNFDYVQDLSNKFNSETIDNPWAIDNREKILTLFSENTLLSSYVPETVECRNVRCQIRVRVSDNQDANKLMNSFSTVLADSKSTLSATSVISAPDLSNGVVTLYIGRHEEESLF